MSDERFENEIKQLNRLKTLLEQDSILPLRFDLERLSLDFRRFKLTIRGIKSLISNPSSGSSNTASTFIITVKVPSGYPWYAIPDIRFQQPISFHPHVFPDGRICWGTDNNKPQPDLFLADWIRGVVEYLQYNQDQGSLLKMNPSSPANGTAMDWWQTNARNISDYVPIWGTNTCFDEWGKEIIPIGLRVASFKDHIRFPRLVGMWWTAKRRFGYFAFAFPSASS